jgi:hypothetical protein
MSSIRCVWIGLAMFACAACNKETPKTGAESTEPSAKTKSKGSGSASSTAKKPASDRPWVDEAGRQAKCEFVKWEGAGKDRKAMFQITPVSKKKISSVQTWEFYYDKSGKYLDRYPHATSVEKEPQALGADGNDIKAGTDTVECEVTRITYEDETRWFNANLIPDDTNRPKGGVTDDFLKEHSGEKVEIEVVDAKKGKLKLHNISDKETKRISIELVYVKKEGHETREAYSTELAIKPGKTKEYTMELDKPPPDDFKSADASAPTVVFDDDTTFLNLNLRSFERP